MSIFDINSIWICKHQSLFWFYKNTYCKTFLIDFLCRTDTHDGNRSIFSRFYLECDGPKERKRYKDKKNKSKQNYDKYKSYRIHHVHIHFFFTSKLPFRDWILVTLLSFSLIFSSTIFFHTFSYFSFHVTLSSLFLSIFWNAHIPKLSCTTRTTSFRVQTKHNFAFRISAMRRGTDCIRKTLLPERWKQKDFLFMYLFDLNDVFPTFSVV